MPPRRMLPSQILDTALAAIAAGVAPATIRDWRRRGLLKPCGGTPRRPLYRAADLAAAQEAARRKPRQAA